QPIFDCRESDAVDRAACVLAEQPLGRIAPFGRNLKSRNAFAVGERGAPSQTAKIHTDVDRGGHGQRSITRGRPRKSSTCPLPRRALTSAPIAARSATAMFST